MDDQAYNNTDREIWREREGDFYADSITVTEGIGIGMHVGGHVIVKPIQDWHKLATAQERQDEARRLVDEQAKDEGLWFQAQTCAEAYVQTALRKLHAAVEGDKSVIFPAVAVIAEERVTPPGADGADPKMPAAGWSKP